MIARETKGSSPQEVQDTPEEDLWFLPGPPEDTAPTDIPWPTADRSSIFSPQEWRNAERTCVNSLVAAAEAFARLDERLYLQGRGALERIALTEVSDLSWAQGDWLASEKIALYMHLRESTVHNAKELSAAAWAMRRMLGGLHPDAGLGAFLGRQHVDSDSLAGIGNRAVGDSFDGLETDWRAELDKLDGVHPITRAGASFYIWRGLGLSGLASVLEAAIVAGRLGASNGRALKFLPVAMGNRSALGQAGSVSDRLTVWYKSVQDACLRAHLLLDQLSDWRQSAIAATQNLNGKTPPALIDAFFNSPVLSTELAAHLSGCSRASAQRNLAIFCERGLILEITEQGRYRF